MTLYHTKNYTEVSYINGEPEQILKAQKNGTSFIRDAISQPESARDTAKDIEKTMTAVQNSFSKLA
jgi:hypothetical protein